MRHIIIKIFDILIWVVAGIIVIAGLIGGIFMLIQGEVVGLAVIIIAPIYAIIFAGMFFMFMGVYENTKKTAEYLEMLSKR